ncbi:MAG: hypothetical protein U0Z17_11640 [Bacteroidales bacterium]
MWQVHSYRSCFILLLLLLLPPGLMAQKSFSVSAGWGVYELVNVGGQWNYSKKSSLSFFAGSNFGIDNNTQWSAGTAFVHIFRKPASWKLKPGYSLGATFWTRDDELYLFKTLSFPIMGVLSYPLSASLSIRAEGGLVLSTVLASDRKQNVQSGYPDRYNGNFSVRLIYNLNKR